ncbi:hypothetical protein [Desulfobacula phenolica]|uniref:Uncharacterized protein n=1 Tax=Desulfobacula phenolica TaxID=90732 RepID=A0A1H2EPZ3_9BACT|nr:hypothetical protein [Desulfobacula phenolica]SDT97161.1 hypothetical protein SAMN04487931_103279 [Desulfobacula phenolica]
MKFYRNIEHWLFWVVCSLVFSILTADNVFSWHAVQLHKGTDAHKLSLIFIPSGFKPDSADRFEYEVAANLKKLWQNNFFADHQQRFDVFRVDDQYDHDGYIKTDARILSLINTQDDCNFGNSRTCRKIHIIIQNESGWNETSWHFVRLRLEARNYYTLAHELSVHVLGNLRPYNGPIMKDEYMSPPRCALQNYTYTMANAHDRDSNEKWKDLVKNPPFEGAAYCSHFFRPFEHSIARSSRNRDCCPVGYKSAIIGLAKRTHDGTFFDELTKPAVKITGTLPGNCSRFVEFNVTTSDISGIDRVEVYTSVDNREYRSLAFDRTNSSRFRIDLESLSGKEFWFRVYVYDGAWNYWGHPDPGSQLGPFIPKR